MKKLLLTTLMLFLSLCFLYSQEGKWDWAKLFQSVGAIATDSWGMDICMDADDNVYIMGVFRAVPLTIGTETLTNRGQYDIFICSFSATGNFRWAKSIGSTGNDDIAGLVISGGDLYIAGAYNGAPVYFTETENLPNSSNYDSFIAHYRASDGAFQSAKRVFWGSGNQRLQDITLDNFNNNLLAVGQFKTHLVYNNGIEDDTIPNLGTKDFFIARYDLSGGFNNLQFHDIKRFYGNNDNTSLKQVNLSVIGSNRTGYFITGDLFGTLSFSPTESITGTSTTSADALVIKVDNNLNYIWSRRGGGIGFDHVNSAGSDQNGNVYLAGKFHACAKFDSTATLQSSEICGVGLQDLYIAKYNREGRLLWVYHQGYPGNDDAFGMDISGNYLQIAGNLSNTGTTNTGFIKLDLAGNYINQGETYGAGEDIGKGVVFDNIGNTYIVGYFNSATLYFGQQSDPDTTLVNTSGTYDGFIGKYQYPLTIVREEVKDVTCNGGNDGYIRVRGEFGVPPYSWSWEHETNLTPVADSLTVGTYIVTLTDSDVPANIVSDTIIISEPEALRINRFINNVSCYNGSNGTINTSPGGGVQPFTYLWSGGAGLDPTDQDQNNLQAGIYNMRLTDANGCILDSTFEVTQPDKLVIDSIKTWNVSPCSASNGSAKVFPSGGTPNYSYLWSNGGITDSIGSLDKGKYSVKVTDDNGCSVTSAQVSIVDSCQVNLLVVDVNNVTCNGGSDGSITLSAFGGQEPYTYNWTPDVGHNDSAAINLSAGNYQIIVADNIGDKDTVNVPLTQPSLLFASGIPSDVTCFGECTGAINLSVSGGTPPYSHKWWPTGDTTEDLTNICFGHYIDTITDVNGCVLTKDYYILHLNTEIKVTGFTDSVSCYGLNDGAIDITVEGGLSPYNYYWLESQWDPDDGLTTQDIEDLFAGEYNVKVTDNVGCVKLDIFKVGQPDPILILQDSIKPSCPGRDDGAAWIHASGGNGGYTYTWEPSGKTGNFVDNMPPLDYEVTVEDVKQCWAIETVTITENTPITVNLDVIKHILCTDSCDGGVFLTVSGGIPPYKWLWFPGGEITEDLINKCAGTYNVTVMDAANCSMVSENFEIEDQSVPIDILRQDKYDISCFGLNDGVIILKSNGKPSMQYSIDNGVTWQTDTLFSGLSAGSYITVFKDANECLKYGNPLDISEPNELEIVGVDSIWNPSISKGGICITVSGGTTPYSYHFIEGNDAIDSTKSENCVENLAGGHYRIIVIDNHQCTDTAEVYALSTEKLFVESDIALYPNPTTGKLTVEIEARDHKDINLEIVNLLGQVVWKKDLQNNGEPRFVEVIDMSQQAKGTYFLRVNGLPVQTKILLE